ncbi:transposase, partial [Aerococcus agrisoli]
TGEYSIATQQGRIKVPCDQSNLDYLQKFSDYKLGEAELLERKGKWYLYISASKDIESVDANQMKHVVGIDRGLRQLITAYDEKGQTLFVSGQDVIKKRRHFKSLRSELQSKNTKSSKKRLKKIEKRENRWMADVNHQLSKALV